MIHHYNSLTHETDRTDYNETLDSYFGHGCAKVILEKRHTLYLAHSRFGDNRVSQWFLDLHERRHDRRDDDVIAPRFRSV